eukprot:5664700-Pyramimonas_sp.AAC.1
MDVHAQSSSTCTFSGIAVTGVRCPRARKAAQTYARYVITCCALAVIRVIAAHRSNTCLCTHGSRMARCDGSTADAGSHRAQTVH